MGRRSGHGSIWRMGMNRLVCILERGVEDYVVVFTVTAISAVGRASHLADCLKYHWLHMMSVGSEL